MVQTARQRWLGVALCIAGLVGLAVLARLWPQPAVPHQVRRVAAWADLPNFQQGTSVAASPQTLTLHGNPPQLLFGDFPGQAVRSVELAIRPTHPWPVDRLLLMYIEATPTQEAYLQAFPQQVPALFDWLEGGNLADRVTLHAHGLIRTRIVRPLVRWEDGVAVCRFDLPMPALWLKLVWPREDTVTLESAQVVLVPRQPESWWPLAGQVFSIGLALGLAWQLAALLAPALGLAASAKRWAMGLLASLQFLTALLLPPFQGPDEYRHWVAALKLYGRQEAGEPVLFRLPELLDALPPRWLADVPFHALQFRRTEDVIAEQEKNFSVGYARAWTYPYVGVVALFYPKVTRLPEALCCYYLARLLPIAIWVLLLCWLDRRGCLTWSLLAFLSLPLMLQQSVVVSSDTLTLQAALAAAAAFVSCRRDGGGWRLAALWLLVLVASVAKPPMALILLPLFLLPWRKLPLKMLTVPLLLAGAAGLAWLALRYGVQLLEGSREDLPGKVLDRVQFVLSPDGLLVFLRSVVTRFSYGWQEWVQPLGWLDTPLSQWHLALLVATVGLALLLDFVELAPGWGRAVMEQPLDLLALWGLVLAHAVGLVLGICFIMFIAHTETENGQSQLIGVQMRYFFPAILLALVVPFGLSRPAASRGLSDSSPSLPLWLVGPLLALLAARGAALAIDLLVRYFG